VDTNKQIKSIHMWYHCTLINELTYEPTCIVSLRHLVSSHGPVFISSKWRFRSRYEVRWQFWVNGFWYFV